MAGDGAGAPWAGVRDDLREDDSVRYSAKILADSLNPVGVRLTTLEVTFPRFILAEFNTHRVLSRSSASSRAIPVAKRIGAVLASRFVPDGFGENCPGMQAAKPLGYVRNGLARATWIALMGASALGAWVMRRIGVHKQHANRPLETYSWQTAIVTATDWDNFFALRCHADAQPEFQRIATMMRDAMAASEPRKLAAGEWHVPFGEDLQLLQAGGFIHDEILLIAIGRSARVSYATHDGRRDPRADIELAERLAKSGHMSPFEHVAYANKDDAFVGNFRGFTQYRKCIPNEDNFGRMQVSK